MRPLRLLISSSRPRTPQEITPRGRPIATTFTPTFGIRTMSTNQTNASAVQTEDRKAAEKPLPLPAPPSEDKDRKLEVVSEESMKLDHLGPMVVNRDGTLSQISNWEHMTEIERTNTLRVLGKRNMLRREALEKEEQEAAKDQ
ncbi:hypothetical protein BCR34DRAFT_580217 [Clohesyomyces aquaticus]|uniref:Uncharacterized protein n=1 Tax=Clohesyomyces aquaticus TaxID=1231657 RepID=A0A1Y1Y7N2_9PLEO|nr:hypothetical protein BCR34DRAFT_580217 [Clohesyomyces aquaticus]